MRIIYTSIIGVMICLCGSSAFAACAPNALGTSRTISIDANKYSSFYGSENSLGLRHKEVILTFDDGPIAGKTKRILNTLKENCVKATFFAVGKMARAYPKLARRIVREGHTLAHHTYDHNSLPKYSLKNASSHIDRGIKLVEKAAYNTSSSQTRTPFFRYPGLASNKATRKLLREKNMVTFGANIDSLDWKKNSPDRIVNRIMKRLKKEKKGIILMHDIHNRTVRMLPKLLDRLKRGGYKVVHMVPYRRGRIAERDPTDNGVKVAALNASNAMEVASVWEVRIADQIASSFIIAYDDIGPIDSGTKRAFEKDFAVSKKGVLKRNASNKHVSNKMRADLKKTSKPLVKIPVGTSVDNSVKISTKRPIKIINKSAIKKWALRSAFKAL